MRFFLRAYRAPWPIHPSEHFVLTSNSWNDYGTICLFHLSHFSDDGVQTAVGEVKILLKEESSASLAKVLPRTELPQEFGELGIEFISLGQEESYYSKLHDLLPSEEISNVLEALRDIAWHPDLASPFEPTSEFRNAMMRSNSAYQARRFGRALALGEKIERNFKFDYQGHIDGAAQPVQTSIHFDKDDELPGRIVCIVGRNAVGKTQFLANLASDLVQIRRTSEESLKLREDRFGGHRPLFTRVLAVSYSAFDRFSRPHSEAVSYVYCGIRSEKGSVTRTGLVDRYRENLKRIREHGRESFWQRYMQLILGDVDEELVEKLREEIESEAVSDGGLSLLSSGQAILAHFVTALLAWLEQSSLVLFDEPETHLHPNAVAVLFNVLTGILQEYDSYCILATHSPIVLQEIPSKRVLLFEREGDVTYASPLGLESFGESISELTRHVFETIEIPTLYRRTLRRLAEIESLEESLARFEEELSMNAQAYLVGQHIADDRDGDDEES